MKPLIKQLTIRPGNLKTVAKSLVMMRRSSTFQHGFTMIEIIVAISILGIIGGMLAMFIRTPVQGYVDSARHAEMNDIADNALNRITGELRLALPNSVRVQNATGKSTCNGTTDTCYLEFIPVLYSGRYRAQQDCSVSGVCTGAVLSAASAISSFDVLGPPMPASSVYSGDWVVVDNLGTTGHSAYMSTDSSTLNLNSVSSVSISSTTFPAVSPSHSFQVISTPVSYVCVPAANGAGTLTRYWGYPVQAAQPVAVPIAGASSALLASNVSACNFVSPPTGITTPGVATIQLTITENGESISLYGEAPVINVP